MKCVVTARLSVSFWFLVSTFCFAQNSTPTESWLFKELKAMPDVVNVVPMKPDSMFVEAYDITLNEPLDHADSALGFFPHHIYLSHLDVSNPMVIEAEGYDAGYVTRPREMTRILKANQVVVEHRYFGNSKPDSMRWEFLTLKNAADDLHSVTTMLKRIYKGKWVSSGISKGGQATLLYRYFYPNDVDVSVAYVAPIPLTLEDPRIFTFLRLVGDAECREKIRQYQFEMLQREDEMLPLMEALGKERKFEFSMGLGAAFEFMVLEYPFAFWQWGYSSCFGIPSPGSPKDSLFKHLYRVVPPRDYSDKGVKDLEPHFYMAYAEIGYYRYDISDFKSLLRYVSDPSYSSFVPSGTHPKYNPQPMQDLHRWLQLHGNNIIFIYGETDTWNACAFEPVGMTNAIKVVKTGGSHRTRIRDLAPEQKELVYSTLEKWLGVNIQR